MSPGEHPLKEEITACGLLHHMFSIADSLTEEAEEMSRPTFDPQVREHLIVHAGYHTVSSV